MLHHKHARDGLLEYMFPKADIPRAPFGPLQVPNILKGYFLGIMNEDISKNKQSTEALHMKLMLTRSSSFELDLGVIPGKDLDIPSKSCVIHETTHKD